MSGALFTPRTIRPSSPDLTHDFDTALDAVRTIRAELDPRDVFVNLTKREVRPLSADRTALPADATDPSAGRFRYRWALQPIRGLSGDAFALREHAFQQLLGRVRYRRDHLERFPAALQHVLLNSLVQAGGAEQEVTLRTARGDQARALVTDAYTPFDDVELLDAVAAVLAERPAIAATARIAWMDIREEATHLRIVWGDDEPIRVGDAVRRGIHISNSEVGLRAVRIEALVFRLVCLNGQIAPRANGVQHLRHVGNRERLVAGVREAVEDASVETERLIADFRRSLLVSIANPTEFLADLAKTEDALTADDLKGALAAWETSGAEHTLFGVTNALTLAAQSHVGERRYGLEAAAGRVLQRGLQAAA